MFSPFERKDFGAIWQHAMIIAHNSRFCNSHNAQNIHIYIIKPPFFEQKSQSEVPNSTFCLHFQNARRLFCFLKEKNTLPRKESSFRGGDRPFRTQTGPLGGRPPKKGLPCGGDGYFALGEYTLTLRLVSKLPDLRVGCAHPRLCALLHCVKEIAHFAHKPGRLGVARQKRGSRVGSPFFWSRRRESNPRHQLGKLRFYH